jgi:hypothetical protein
MLAPLTFFQIKLAAHEWIAAFAGISGEFELTG